MHILGIRIDNLGKKEILEKIEFFLDEEKFHQIATINPEFILQAQKDCDFKNVISMCNLNVADGAGIGYAFLRFGKFLKTRLAGVDLLTEILQIANDKKLSVFLAINKDGLSSYKEIVLVLNKNYPNINFFGEDINPRITDYQLLITSYSILFCNFGAPAQEKFINSQKNAKLRLAMGVGGSFDFIIGKIVRAPIWMRAIGLEWLWRFAQEPKYRAKRIFNATIVFPIKILFSKK
ncbi:MAG: WecB/TagA/CpsF family glycosyltransferase [Candidatus Moraniibacteriota bacterium]